MRMRVKLFDIQLHLAMNPEVRKSKRAHRSLSIADKVKILNQIGQKSYKLLSEEFGVGISTISDIKKKVPELRNFKRKMAEMGCCRAAKSMKMGKDQELDMAVFLWFRLKREEGVPITGKFLTGCQ